MLHEQKAVSVLINESVRLDVTLELGAATETVTVSSGATTLDFETATRQEGIAPETLSQLPLIIGGKPRSSASFTISSRESRESRPYPGSLATRKYTVPRRS